MTIEVVEIDARTRLLKGLTRACVPHPTRPWVALTESPRVPAEPREAAVFDLREMRVMASWRVACAEQRLFWAGDRVLEFREYFLSEQRPEVALRELPDGGEVACATASATGAPQLSLDGRTLYVPEVWQGALLDLPGLERQLGFSLESDRELPIHARCLHPDGASIAFLHEERSRWSVSRASLRASAMEHSPWYAWPSDVGGLERSFGEVGLSWLGPRALLVSRGIDEPTSGLHLHRLWALEHHERGWRMHALGEREADGPWMIRHELSRADGRLAVVFRPVPTGAPSLAVLDPRSGRCLASRAWPPGDRTPFQIAWMDPDRLAVLSARAGAPTLHVWDLRDGSLSCEAIALDDDAWVTEASGDDWPALASDAWLEYCGYRDGEHIMRLEATLGPRGVIVMRDEGFEATR